MVISPRPASRSSADNREIQSTEQYYTDRQNYQMQSKRATVVWFCCFVAEALETVIAVLSVER